MADDRRELRAALISSHLIGLMLNRFVLRSPDLAAATDAELITTVGPIIQHYLTGPIAEHRRPMAKAPGRVLCKADLIGSGPSMRRRLGRGAINL